MRRDYFEMNLKKLMQKSRPAAYRSEFKEDLFCQMTREINRSASLATKPRKNILWNLISPFDLRLILKAAAVPVAIMIVGTSYLMDSMMNLPADNGKVIVFQSADSRDYVMGNGQNAINYIAQASSSHGNFHVLPEIRNKDLPKDLLQSSATNI